MQWQASRKRDRRDWFHWILFGVRREPAPAFRGLIERPDEERPTSGICCSGGGIRSAAFNLGALQALQEEGELQRSNYVAAVSGGSYIAAAFAMVGKHWPGDKPCRPSSDPTKPSNGHDDSNPELIRRVPPFARGSPEEQYLRNRTSYLAPGGIDKAFLGIRIALGLLFNLVFLGIPLMAISMLAGTFIYADYFPDLRKGCGGHACAANIHHRAWIVPLAILAAALVFALLGMIRRVRHEMARRFLDVWAVRLTMAAVALAVLTTGLPAIIQGLHDAGASSGTSGTQGGTVGLLSGGGLAGVLAGVFLQLRQAFATPKQAIKELKSGRKALAKLSRRARVALAYIAGAVLGPAILFLFVVWGLSLALAHTGKDPNPAIYLPAIAGLLGFWGLYLAADLTSWSLHPFYKRRLCTAFALKRILPTDNLTSAERDRVQVPGGQAADDGIAVERDYDELVSLSKTDILGGDWPILVVCAAANVSDPGATPHGRSVTSFTFSPYSIGGPLVGGIRTGAFEAAFEDRKRDFSLLTAVAVSGAALSPSMGKMTRRPLTFLLALANVRLGVWIPNPRWVAGTKKAERRWFGRPRPSYLFRELLGRNHVDAKYLYVTDGGHYENLGLVELLRRGCTRIYCFDASGGESFDELGDAIAIARSELNVEIDIDPSPLSPEGTEKLARSDTVSGMIRYLPQDRGGNVVTGTLVYSRNVMTEISPWDVHAYHDCDPTFPHNPTADQLYTDQKFEGYRVLGERAARHGIELMRKSDTNHLSRPKSWRCPRLSAALARRFSS
jgi:hypothetical protein